MSGRRVVVLLLIVLAGACQAQTIKMRKATTLEDSVEHARSLGTPQALTGMPEARTGLQDRASAQVVVKNVTTAWVDQQETNRDVVVQSTVLQISFDAFFRTSQVRCRQPVFQAKGQVQHADTTRSKLPAGQACPYSVSLPLDVVDAVTIPPVSRVTLKIPAKPGDKLLYLAIQATDNRALLWQQGRELRDDEPVKKPSY